MLGAVCKGLLHSSANIVHTHMACRHCTPHTTQQDLLAALILSECVYKKLEMPPEALAATVASFLADFPSDIVHLEALQLSRDDITQK